MDARRLELYELLKPKLDEEPAKALVLALPSDPDSLATRADLSATNEALTAAIVVQLIEARPGGEGASA